MNSTLSFELYPLKFVEKDIENEKKLIKPYFKNSDISKFSTSEIPEKFLLYLTRDLNINNYPNIKEIIQKYFFCYKIFKNKMSSFLKTLLIISKFARLCIVNCKNEIIFALDFKAKPYLDSCFRMLFI